MKRIYHKNSLYVIFLAFLVYPLFSYKNLAKEWVKVEIDSVVSVQFPDQPSPQNLNGIQVYTLHTPEAVFMTMTFEQALKPGQSPVSDAHEFYLGFINSMVRNAKATLTDSASFTIKGHKGMEFSYTSVKEDGSKHTRFNRSILRKDKLYSLLYTPLIQPAEALQDLGKQFFQSLAVNE